jgi:uncharacterized flavoprotein (TIGR03862 family)
MAAEELSGAGHGVLLVEAKPSVGRKFLMAGKSGLNITKQQDRDAFAAAYTHNADWLGPILTVFGPTEARTWADSLGAETFAGSSGRVFPRAMKASPLLRAWLQRLVDRGVEIRTRWRWTGWQDNACAFWTPHGTQTIRPRTTVLALGGASWPRLGSDGAWRSILAEQGIAIAQFQPSNVGCRIEWAAHMARHFGAAVKPVAVSAGTATSRSEIVVSARGLEGSGIYAVAHRIRAGAALVLDLVPDLSTAEACSRLSRFRGRNSLSNHLRKTLALSPVKIALLRECVSEPIGEPESVVHALKALRMPVLGLHPLAEAISTAGGVCRSELTPDLMLKALPGTFCAGEMLDWDAPTGGYLLTACLATGSCAGRGAARWIEAGKAG